MWSLRHSQRAPLRDSCGIGSRQIKLQRWKGLPLACPFKGILNSSSVDDLPFKGFPPGKPYKLLLGLQHPEDPWLDVDEDDNLLVDQLKQRAAHIRDRRDAVIQLSGEPRAREASWELLHQLMDELPARYPSRFALEGPVIRNLLTGNSGTGESFDTAAPGVEPLEVIGRITQEDYCLLAPPDSDPGGGGGGGGDGGAPGSSSYRLVGGVVCFPAHWSVLEKLGMELPDIHDPVPRWRRMHPIVFWTPTSAVDQVPPPGAAKDNADTADVLQLRLSRTGYVVFTIRTYMQPLRQAVQGRPRVAAALAGALRDLPYEHLQYKSNLQKRMPALLELLDSVAMGTDTAGTTTATTATPAATTAAVAAGSAM
ncbi:hypothetical protein VOLCADRAFT_91339 [Volvox carteri f. nagariensis]|uniref:Uncharacterized protein n=1 Tax=Volvox carteri f. nagariensis TaxID=3068 RepID=D8TWT5_VOLCA|nr:uncharacterized protein VOLCADRAFT_91339 [Volvox carteri f. nagariensis]EFJ48104.1 hypothetical protein VOLCADRAFT_91339 [Volvox carteri f. nagariensis]|eukprot:XP_002950789.1 hypothetical protein VOLCADRAFT_91339 [Volvox carteri f. nagariensis]